MLQRLGIALSEQSSEELCIYLYISEKESPFHTSSRAMAHQLLTIVLQMIISRSSWRERLLYSRDVHGRDHTLERTYLPDKSGAIIMR